jgi:hypothetical protein
MAASLHHHRVMPGDIGVPELSHGDADSFAAPPLDLDELAACAGQSRAFGPLVGRLIMAVGSFFAVYAAVAATQALREDAGTLEELAQAKQNLARRRPSQATRALGRLLEHEMGERQRARWANRMLLPGAVGMAVNLLASAELLGHFVPALVPVANFAMGPAAICMTLYGGYVAFISARAWHHSRKAEGQRADAAQRLPRSVSDPLVSALKSRESQKRFWDVALGVSGALQAAGALLQWALGPIYLLLLLPGTVGLMVFKLLRAQALGTQTVGAGVDADRYDKPLAQLAADYGRAQTRTAELHQIRAADGRASATLRRKLHDALAADAPADAPLLQHLRSSSPTPTQEAQDGVAALAQLGAFTYLALEVARCPTLPRTRQAREDGTDYTISAEDIVDLVASAPTIEAAAHLSTLRQVFANVAQAYGVAIARQEEGILAELTGQMLAEMRASALARP